MLSKKTVKYIQSLSHKKLRDVENCFVAEGPKIVIEFLSSQNIKCKMVCATKDWIDAHSNLFQNLSADAVYEIDEMILQKISLLRTPNKVVAVFEKKNLPAAPVIANKLSLMLDDIQDPGNLGTLIRIADWFEIENIICSENCVDCYNFKVVQATMGSLLRVNIWNANLIQFIKENKNISVYAAALSGISLNKIKNIEEGILLIGNESKGISDELLMLAEERITIPRYGKAESLNAAVAAGIILSHLK